MTSAERKEIALEVTGKLTPVSCSVVFFVGASAYKSEEMSFSDTGLSFVLLEGKVTMWAKDAFLQAQSYQKRVKIFIKTGINTTKSYSGTFSSINIEQIGRSSLYNLFDISIKFRKYERKV